MRSIALAAAVLAMGSPAMAQPRVAPAEPPSNVDAQLPSMAEDRAANEALTSQLAALDLQIYTDEARATQLRDADLARSNAVMRSIRPALKFHGRPPR